MKWLKGVVGLLLALVGVAWLGQGTGLLPGSFMSGRALWAVIGLICLAIGGWLVLRTFRSGTSAG